MKTRQSNTASVAAPQEDGATVETRKALDQFHRSQWRLLRAFPEDVPIYFAYREYAWRKSLPI